eukprot:354135-Chlamydomonas_euryale.AAC.7
MKAEHTGAASGQAQWLTPWTAAMDAAAARGPVLGRLPGTPTARPHQSSTSNGVAQHSRP